MSLRTCIKIAFFEVILSSLARYTYGKGAKGRANVLVYFNTYLYDLEKRSSVAKDIPVSTIIVYHFINIMIIVHVLAVKLLFIERNVWPNDAKCSFE